MLPTVGCAIWAGSRGVCLQWSRIWRQHCQYRAPMLIRRHMIPAHVMVRGHSLTEGAAASGGSNGGGASGGGVSNGGAGGGGGGGGHAAHTSVGVPALRTEMAP